MKTSYWLVVGALAAGSALPARVSASPGGFSGRLTPYRKYVADGITAPRTESDVYRGGPRRWGFGAYTELQRRRVGQPHGFGSSQWDTDNILMTVSYDALPWVTLIAGAGRSGLTLGGASHGADTVWALAARMRLLDYFVFDPLKTADPYWCRVDAVVHYWQSEAERAWSSLEWNEWRAALTVGFASRPQRLTYLDGAGFYVGPAYSRLAAEEARWRDESRGVDEFGVVAGVFLNPSRNTLLKAEVYRFERNSLNISAGFHF